jgi:cobalt/nickel transport system permease protein
MSLLAVHISDGILAAPWWLAGLVVTGILALAGAWRVRDEEIPRIALLTAAFFVASLIHVRIGPTSVHLLLNGLAGVLLGWRAALAIPAAVLLQAVLFGHGGFTTVGINSCIMTIPALASWGLFALLQKVPWRRRPWFRSTLVAGSSAVWLLSMVYSVTLLWTNRMPPQSWQPIDTTSTLGLLASPDGPLVAASALAPHSPVRMLLGPAYTAAFHPVTLLAALLVSLGVVRAERKLENAPEFPLGLVVGEFAVLATVALNCVVLLEGGEQNWTLPALILVVVHLPIAVVEGIVLGFTVGLLARVRPDILGLGGSAGMGGVSEPYGQRRDAGDSAPSVNGSPKREPMSSTKASALLSFVALLGLAGPATAHSLEGEYKVLPDQKVRVESWFSSTGDAPAAATVQVFRETGEVLAEGRVDAKGIFLFSFPRPEPLRVVISAGAGHRKELHISRSELGGETATPVPAEKRADLNVKDALLGITFLLALAAFVLSYRNARQLRKTT